MKYEITIEETNAKDFKIEAESAKEVYEIAEYKRKLGVFVLNPGEYQFKQIAITSSNSEATERGEL